jgi:signal transduction histidine kinase
VREPDRDPPALYRLDRAMPLSAKLSVVLLLVILAGGATAFLVLRGNTRDHFEELSLAIGNAHLEMTNGALAAYYDREGTWTGVESLLVSPMITGNGFHDVVLTSPDGRVLAATDSTLRGDTLGPGALAEGFPILVGTDTVAVAVAGTAIGALSPAQERSLSALASGILTAGIAAAAVALVLGLLLLRRITRPIRYLAQATEDVSAGRLDRRVEWPAKDAIGRLADAFNAMTARLAHSEQLRKQMVADIAHELRNPVAVIRADLQAMIDGIYALDESRVRSLQEETALLTRLIDDLRTLSLADAGELTLQPRAVDLTTLVRRVAESQRRELERKGVALEVDLQSDDVPAWADPERIEQVLLNLLRNARQHTPDGGSVHVSLRSRDGGADITVADNGSGIPDDILPHVFDRFWRGENRESGSRTRSGLGLPIARRLVEAHGGTIRLESTPGEGTTVRVWLATAAGDGRHPPEPARRTGVRA